MIETPNLDKVRDILGQKVYEHFVHSFKDGEYNYWVDYEELEKKAKELLKQWRKK